MKLVSAEFGQVMQLASYSRPRGQLYIPEVVRKLQERYAFMKIPQTLEEWDDTKGATFQHGRFGDAAIHSFQIYQNGLLASAKSEVEVVDSFVSDVLEWAEKEFDLELINETPLYKAFDSQIVIQTDVELETKIFDVSKIGQMISDFLNDYGVDFPPYQISGFSLHNESLDPQSIAPAAFKFERRLGQPYERGLYFSSAPLMTKDHLRLLDEVEKIFGG